MPEKTPLPKLPYYSMENAANGASQQMSLAMALDSRIILRADSSADLSAKYASAPKNSLAVSASSESVWLKLSENDDWLAIYEDSGEVTSGFALGDGFDFGSYCFARRINHQVEVRSELIYTGDDPVTGGTSGVSSNILDMVCLVIPPKFATTVRSRYISFWWESNITGGGGVLYNGNVVLRDMHTDGHINNGQFVRFSITFMD